MKWEVLNGQLFCNGVFSREATQAEIALAAAIVARGVCPRCGAHSLVPVEALSDRQLEVFRLLGQGMSTKRIASQLHLSPKTVETHREHIKQKIGAKHGVALIHMATNYVAGEKPNA